MDEPRGQKSSARRKQPQRLEPLTDEELRNVFQASAAAGPTAYLYVLLLALTGQRATEVSDLRWEDLDLDQAVWSRSKRSQRSVTVLPLSTLAVQILGHVQRLAGHCEGKIFHGTGQMRPAAMRAALNKHLQSSESALTFSVHAFRRTVSHYCFRRGFDAHTTYYILLRQEPYWMREKFPPSRADLLDRAKPVLEAWSKHISIEVLNGDGIDYSALTPKSTRH